MIVYTVTGKDKVLIIDRDYPKRKPKEVEPKPENISLRFKEEYVPDETFFGLAERMLHFCIKNTVKKNGVRFHRAMV